VAPVHMTHESYTKHGVFEVMQFNGVIEI